MRPRIVTVTADSREEVSYKKLIAGEALLLSDQIRRVRRRTWAQGGGIYIC